MTPNECYLLIVMQVQVNKFPSHLLCYLMDLPSILLPLSILLFQDWRLLSHYYMVNHYMKSERVSKSVVMYAFT